MYRETQVSGLLFLAFYHVLTIKRATIYCNSLEYEYIIRTVRIDRNGYDCYNRLQKDTAEKTMNRFLNFTKNFLITAAILVCGFLLSLFMQKEWGNQTLIPAIFLLDVFLVSVITDGFLYGAVASVISILAVNYAFTFPFFKINFTIPENMISAVIMIAIAVITCGFTNKLKSQEQLKAESEQEKMRANLLRSVSHDFRTPLTTIYGASSAMLDDKNEFTEEQKKRMLRGIKQDAQWLSRMVENMLSITRLDGKNVKIIKIPIALDELLDSVLVKFNKRYEDQNVEIDMPDELIMIPMDAILVEQLILNLLENAVQHAEGMNKLGLRVYTSGHFAVFEIRDNGCGIPVDKVKDIFAGKLVYGESGLDSSKKNAGIGLSVCTTIVKAHGGEISAENLQDGGAVVRFTLDMEETEND